MFTCLLIQYKHIGICGIQMCIFKFIKEIFVFRVYYVRHYVGNFEENIFPALGNYQKPSHLIFMNIKRYLIERSCVMKLIMGD